MTGYISKATDSVSVIGDIGTGLGVWVFVASIISAYSRYPLTAAINIVVFFLSILASYYVYGLVVLGAIVTALLTSILFASGYSAFYTHNIVSFLSLILGLILIFFLPRKWKKNIIAFGLSIVLAFIIDRFIFWGYCLFSCC